MLWHLHRGSNLDFREVASEVYRALFHACVPIAPMIQLRLCY